MTRTTTAYFVSTADAVWNAITDPCQTPKFLFGMSVESTWVEGAPLTFHAPEGHRLQGTIVHADPGHLLVHSFANGADESATSWITWELEQVGLRVCRVSVTVDDPDDGTDPDPDCAWDLVLQNLEQHLETRAAAGNAHSRRPEE